MNQNRTNYATPIWRCESKHTSAMRTLGFLVGMLGMCLIGALILVSFLYWFGILY
jgi:hypothetical protein